VPPGYVRNLEDYWAWLDQLIDGSGGALDGPGLEIQALLHETDDTLVGLDVPRQRLRFPLGTFLEIRLRVNQDLVAEAYTFHYQWFSGELIWRKDKHPGHEHLGGQEHIHRVPHDPHRADPYHEVDLEEALHQVSGHLLTSESTST
jgi:hypothetical protein